MAITSVCPQCGAKLNIDPALAGRRVRCTRCQGTFVANPASPSVDGVGRIKDRASRLPAGPATQAPRARRRRREDDDYDDRSSEEAPQTRNTGLVIGLAVGGGVVVLAIAVTAILLIVNAASRQGEVVVKKPSKVEDRVFKPGPLP